MKAAIRKAVMGAAAAIIIFNLLDAVFTMLYVGSGLATEGNPVMEKVLVISPVLFVIAKFALVSAGVLLLWRLRRRPAAVFGMMATATAYSALVAYHLSEAHRLAALLP